LIEFLIEGGRVALNKFVSGMAMFRLLSGTLEILAALLMLRWNQVEKALLVNSGLALVGPFVLLATTAIGLAGMADKLSWGKLLWIVAGVGCIFAGILKK
jgi:putative exporter of polyketide antibiotics